MRPDQTFATDMFAAVMLRRAFPAFYAGVNFAGRMARMTAQRHGFGDTRVCPEDLQRSAAMLSLLERRQ